MKTGVTFALTFLLLSMPVLACEKHRAMTAADQQRAPYTLRVLSPETLIPGQNATVKLTLNNPDNTPIDESMLAIVHEKKMHLLIISGDFKEYHHIHPQQVTGESGVYEATFTPKKTGFYLWTDVTPPGGQAYVATMLGTLAKKSDIDLKPQQQASSTGITASIADATLIAGSDAQIQIALRDDAGKPLTLVEPYLGALGHLVGFSVDGKRILHAHPVDDEYPASGVLSFHVNAPHSGIWKLFLQVQQNGTVHTFPFTVAVARAAVKPVNTKGGQHDHH